MAHHKFSLKYVQFEVIPIPSPGPCIFICKLAHGAKFHFYFGQSESGTAIWVKTQGHIGPVFNEGSQHKVPGVGSFFPRPVKNICAMSTNLHAY